MSGWPWTALQRLGDVPTEALSQRAALLAAVAWADRDGYLRPSIETWARVAGLEPRTLQRVLRRLEALGVVERTEPSAGGPGRTAVYRIPALAYNPDARSGIQPRQSEPATPTCEPTNPDVEGSQPRRTVGGTSKNSTERQGERPAPGGIDQQLMRRAARGVA